VGVDVAVDGGWDAVSEGLIVIVGGTGVFVVVNVGVKVSDSVVAVGRG
jgi:hypothetical protein